jgi:hypothetical protein
MEYIIGRSLSFLKLLMSGIVWKGEGIDGELESGVLGVLLVEYSCI